MNGAMGRREGIEAEVVARLTEGIEPEEVRRVLERCLAGELSPQVALTRMVCETENLSVVRAAVDEVTDRAATDSRAGDTLVRDRVDDLTELFVENEPGCAAVVRLLRSILDAGAPAASVEEGIAQCERLFDRAVRQSEEASVALYSLGSPSLLEQATHEIVDLFERWRVLGPDRTVLHIGCGVGRIEAALARRVKAAYGLDVSAEMIKAARRRTAGYANVHLAKSSGRDLQAFGDEQFDLVYAVDTFPYLQHAGGALVEEHFREARRVLRPGGDFVILNYSFRDDEGADRTEVARLAEACGFALLVNGERPFTLWDGVAFRMQKR
jgi:SAM-dependent methyltransferase